MTEPMIAGLLGCLLLLIFVAVLVGSRLRPSIAGPVSDAKLRSIVEELEAVKGKVGSVENRIRQTAHDLNNVRTIVENLPSKDLSHRLEVEMTALAGKVGKLEAEVMATSRGVERIEDILLRSGKT